MLSAQLCFSNVSCARRLKASAALVPSRRGAVMPQVQWEQHQAVKVDAFDPDRAFAHTSPTLCVRLGLKLGGDGGNTTMHRARKVDSCPSPKTISHGIASGKSD